MASGGPAKVAVLVQGRKESGKSTLGRELVERHGFVEVALADALREVATTAFNGLAGALAGRASLVPLTVEACVSQATKERPLAELVGAGGLEWALAGKALTPRWLLQWLGTDVCRRAMGEDVWVHAAMGRVAAAGAARVVVTDVRFRNEAARLPELLRAAGFAVVQVRVVNPADGPLPADAHASEREVDGLPHDRLLVNDKARGVAAFHAEISACLKEFL